MINEKHESADNIDDIMLPGFRFHPTDEELVSFYLKRKIQQRPLSIELIKQVDIYKYDPWDLPKIASTGEKEWYFYCPRDRKYRNSARPNRVTKAGFWKATGTDRPVYSSDGSKCIGLKKSLVFYQGRAAKGMKTDWMMHEFRLPSLTNSMTLKRPIDKNLPANDAWAICRIFKKTNTIAQRALSQSWISSVPTNSTTETSSSTQPSSNNDFKTSNNVYSFPPVDIPAHKPIEQTVSTQSILSTINGDFPSGFNMLSSLDMLSPSSLLGDNNNNPSNNLDFARMQQPCDSFPIRPENDTQRNTMTTKEDIWFNSPKVSNVYNQLGNFESVEFPIPMFDEWRPNLLWDSLSFPTELSIDYSDNKYCYT